MQELQGGKCGENSGFYICAFFGMVDVGGEIRDLQSNRLILIVEIPFKSGSIDLSETVRSAFERDFYDKDKSF